MPASNDREATFVRSVAVSGHPEFHPVTIPNAQATLGNHSLTTVMNVDVAAGMKDDFVLQWIGAKNDFGAKIGW